MLFSGTTAFSCTFYSTTWMTTLLSSSMLYSWKVGCSEESWQSLSDESVRNLALCITGVLAVFFGGDLD